MPREMSSQLLSIVSEILVLGRTGESPATVGEHKKQ